MASYDELLKEYKRLAKRADQRLVRLEGYSHREGFKTATKWAYGKAMKNIKYWSGASVNRFNVKPPKSKQGIEAKIRDIQEFLSSETSTLKGIKTVYVNRAKTINKKYGTKFTWEDLAKYYLSGTAEKLDKTYGSKTALYSIAEIQKSNDKIIEEIKKSKDKIEIVDDDIVNDTINSILKETIDLDLSMLF